MEALHGVMLAVLLVAVLAWFILLERLADRLARRHPHRYASLGLDAVRMRAARAPSDSNNFAAVLALFRFLLGAESRRLADAQLRQLVLGMRGVLLVSLGLLLAAVLVGITGSAPAAAGRQGTTHLAGDPEDRAKAIRLDRSGQLAEALVQYDALLSGPARDADLLYRRALLHARLGHEERALQDLGQLQAWEPSHFEAHLRADRILADQQRWGDMLALWGRFLRTEPNHAQALLERARVHLHEGDRQAALADARRACELGRRDACRTFRRLQEGP